MSSIPSFIANITSGIYGTFYENDPIVEQFRYHLGLSPGESIPDTVATEETYIAFLARRAALLQYISTISKQILGSAADVENAIAGFRSYLGLGSTDPIPDTPESKELFLDYLASGNSTLLSIAAMTKDVYGSATAAVQLLDGYRNSLGLVADQPIPNTSAAQAAFISYLASQTKTFGFLSEFTRLVTGSEITEPQLASFRAYLGLEAGDALPDEFATRSEYIKFLSLTHDFASYAATAVKNAYNTSIIQNVAVLAAFRASLQLDPDAAIASDADTKHAFLYFLTSPTTLAAHGFYGISYAAANSLAAFRATVVPSLASGVPLPTDEATREQYLAFLHGTDTVTPQLGIAKFILDTTAAITGAPLVNEMLAKFRAYLGLAQADAIPDDEISKAHYMSFLQSKLAAVGKSEAINAISPHEDTVRRILFSAFSMVLEMLTTLQQTARLESKAIQLYAEWQKEYTNLVTSTPIYGPVSLNQVIANNDDFGRTTLGHEGITVRQVADWLLHEIQRTGSSSATFNVTNPAHDYPGFPCFIMTRNANGSYSLTLRAPLRDGWGGFYNNWQNLLTVTISPSTILAGEALNTSLIDNMMIEMTKKWQANSFDQSSFNVYAKVWDRKSTGSKSEIGDLYQAGAIFKSYSTSYLKTLWSGTSEKIWFTDEQFDGHDAPIYAYQDWIDGDGNLTVTGGNYWPIRVTVINNLPTTLDGWSNFQLGTITGGDLAPDKNHVAPEFRMQIHYASNTGTVRNYTMVCYATWLNKKGKRQYDWGPTFEFEVTSTDSNVGTGFWGPWNAPGIGAWPETVPYPSKFSKSSLQNIRSQASSYIGEINAQLQQYVQSTQARKENIDNAMKVMQNLLSQTLQATSNQINLLDAIMQSLKSILSAIFH